MFSNLKAFFAERDIDIADILQTIKQNKRGGLSSSIIGGMPPTSDE
jgi:hypothetical protein